MPHKNYVIIHANVLYESEHTFHSCVYWKLSYHQKIFISLLLLLLMLIIISSFKLSSQKFTVRVYIGFIRINRRDFNPSGHSFYEFHHISNGHVRYETYRIPFRLVISYARLLKIDIDNYTNSRLSVFSFSILFS